MAILNNKTIYFIYADNRAISGELLSTGMTTQRRKKMLEEFKDRICDSQRRFQEQIQADHGHLREFQGTVRRAEIRNQEDTATLGKGSCKETTAEFRALSEESPAARTSQEELKAGPHSSRQPRKTRICVFR